MRQDSIIHVPYKEYKKGTAWRIALSAAIFLVAAAVNIVLYLFVTTDTQVLFTVLNILIDIIVLWGLFFYYMMVMWGRFSTARIYRTALSHGRRYSGTVTALKGRMRVRGLDCRELSLDCNGVTRKVYVPAGSFNDMLIEGREVNIVAAENIAAGCEVRDDT